MRILLHLDHLVKICFASDDLRIGRSITAGDSERQLSLLQNVHGSDNLPVGTAAPSGIRRLFKSFDTDRGNEILHPQHLLREGLVY